MEPKKKIVHLHLFVSVVALSILLVYGLGSLLIFAKFLGTHPSDSFLQRFLEIVPFGESPTTTDVLIRCGIIVCLVVVLFMIYLCSLFFVLASSILLQAIIFKPFIDKNDLEIVFVSSRKLFYFMDDKLFPFVGKTYDFFLSLIIGSGNDS